MSSPAVEYRAVPFRPAYRVGDDGTVWSCLGVQFLGRYGSRSVLTKQWRKLPGSIDKRRGYVKVTLQPGNRTFDVHTLVLRAFAGPPPPGMECLHGDGNKTNNRLSNLRWGTPTENSQDRRRHGNMKVGEDAYHAKLSNAQVREIRRLHESGEATRKQLQERFGVSKSLIRLIVTNTIRKETPHAQATHSN